MKRASNQRLLAKNEAALAANEIAVPINEKMGPKSGPNFLPIVEIPFPNGHLFLWLLFCLLF